MKNFLIKLVAGLLLVTAFYSCSKYKTQFEGPYSDIGGVVSLPVIYEVVYCVDGQIFMADKFLRKTKQLPGIVGATKVSINDAHSRIAYQTTGGNIMVIDSAGAPISTIANSTTVDWFDFHANNQTIYLLKDHKLSLNGPNVPLAATNLENVLPYLSNDYTILAAAVAADGSVVFGYQVYTGFNYAYGVYVRRMDGSKLDLMMNYETPFRLRLANQTNDFVISAYDTGSGIKYYTGSFSSSQLYGDYNDAFFTIAADNSEILYGYPNGAGSIIYQKYGGRQLDIAVGAITDIDW